MGKQAEALRTIGEASAELDIKPHILRYWEEQFPTLDPLKRAGGRRYYRPGDMELLRHIHSMINEQGLTIAGARKALQRGERHFAIAAAPSSGSQQESLPGDIEARLRSIRERLQKAAALIEN